MKASLTAARCCSWIGWVCCTLLATPTALPLTHRAQRPKQPAGTAEQQKRLQERDRYAAVGHLGRRL